MQINKPIWPGWETVRLIGRGTYGDVYEIQRQVFSEREGAALKVISIPHNESELEELYNEGYDEESISTAYKNQLESIVREYSLVRKLGGCNNIVHCEDLHYEPHADGIGWDIFIKMELLTPMMKALPATIGEKMVIDLGRDLCTALDHCARYNVIHRDIKPQNIFLSDGGSFKLGDFGIAKIAEKTMSGTKAGTYRYMAPEVYNNKPYGANVDIYSLGLVMYWMLNRRRLPFMPMTAGIATMEQTEEAKSKRFAGEPLPPPLDGSDALKQIVLKACAFDPAQRYHTAWEMLQDLNKLHTDPHSFIPVSNADALPTDGPDGTVRVATFTGTTPKTAAPKETAIKKTAPEETAAGKSTAEPTASGKAAPAPKKAAPKKKKKSAGKAIKSIAVILVVLGLLLALLGGAVALVLGVAFTSVHQKMKKAIPDQQELSTDCERVMLRDGYDSEVMAINLQEQNMNVLGKTYVVHCEAYPDGYTLSNPYIIKLHYNYKGGDWVLGNVSAALTAPNNILTPESSTGPANTTPVTIPCTQLILNRESILFNKLGETWNMAPRCIPENTTDTLSFTSDDQSVVTVSQDGTITVVGEGEATVIAICGDQTAHCTVRVAVENSNTEAPSSNTTVPATTAPNVIEFEDVISTASTDSAEVPCMRMELNREDVTITVGEKFLLIPTCYPKNTTDEVTYQTTNPMIAIADAHGRVTGYAAGTATIKVTCGTQTATCVVRVQEQN